LQEAEKDGSTSLALPPLADYSDMGIEWTEDERARLLEIKARKSGSHYDTSHQGHCEWDAGLRSEVLQFLKSHTITEVSRMFGVPVGTIYKWKKTWGNL